MELDYSNQSSLLIELVTNDGKSFWMYRSIAINFATLANVMETTKESKIPVDISFNTLKFIADILIGIHRNTTRQEQVKILQGLLYLNAETYRETIDDMNYNKVIKEATHFEHPFLSDLPRLFIASNYKQCYAAGILRDALDDNKLFIDDPADVLSVLEGKIVIQELTLYENSKIEIPTA